MNPNGRYVETGWSRVGSPQILPVVVYKECTKEGVVWGSILWCPESSWGVLLGCWKSVGSNTKNNLPCAQQRRAPEVPNYSHDFSQDTSLVFDLVSTLCVS